MTAGDRNPRESPTDRLPPDTTDTVSGSACEESLVPAAWRGVTLTHRGNDIGLISHVTRSGKPSVVVLHALGGVSRSLEYTVPATAIVAVSGVPTRAVVCDEVEFEPRRLCADGRVILAPRISPEIARSHDADWLDLPRAVWVGTRMHADDGYLGIVEAALSTKRSETVDLLAVHVRMPFWKKRLPIIPVTRVLACTPAEKVARVTGSRSELASMSERLPCAEPSGTVARPDRRRNRCE